LHCSIGTLAIIDYLALENAVFSKWRSWQSGILSLPLDLTDSSAPVALEVICDVDELNDIFL
jgi:hypothetical protein